MPAIVITGASQGLGQALSLQLARRSPALILVARTPEPLGRVVAEIQNQGACTVRTLALDVTEAGAADRIAEEARAAGWYVDELVNNAGMGLSGPFSNQQADDIAALVRLNVEAATALMRHFLPGMLARGRGGVLNIASLGGYTPGPYQAAYYASKAYLIALTQAVAWEVRGHGVRVAVACPGPFETEFHAKMRAERSLYRLLIPSPSAPSIAGAAIRGYDFGLGVIHPGSLAPAASVFLSVMPRFMLLPIMGGLLWPRRSDR
jgi:short-subunit dehydrogenase